MNPNITIIGHSYKYGGDENIKYTIQDNGTKQTSIVSSGEIPSSKIVRKYWLNTLKEPEAAPPPPQPPISLPKAEDSENKKETKIENPPQPAKTETKVEIQIIEKPEKENKAENTQQSVKTETQMEIPPQPIKKEIKSTEKHEKTTKKAEKTETEKHTKKSNKIKEKSTNLKPKHAPKELWKDPMTVEIVGFKRVENINYICIKHGKEGLKLVTIDEAKSKFPAQLVSYFEGFVVYREEDII